MKAAKQKLPGSVALHLTENCNLRCKMCYVWGEKGAYSTAGPDIKPTTLDFDVVKKLVKKVVLFLKEL